MNKPFENWEIIFLRLTYPIEDINDISNFLHRPKSSIYNKCKSLDIIKLHKIDRESILDINQYPELEQWQVCFILLTYPYIKPIEISKYLNLSKNKIKGVAVKFNIKNSRHYERFYIGEIIGKYTIVGISKNIIKSNNGPCKLLDVRCSQCNNISQVKSSYIVNKHYNTTACYRCKTVGYIYGSLYINIKSQAKERKIEFSVSKEYLNDLLIKQKFKCSLSGVDLLIPIRNKDSNSKTKTLSLDRIDSSKGYIEGNVQWVHKDVNLMKWKLEQNYFIKMCKKIVDNSIDIVIEPYTFIA